MHNTFRNCCREEKRGLSRKTTRTDTTKRLTEIVSNEAAEVFGKKDNGGIRRQISRDNESDFSKHLEKPYECLEMIQSSF